MNILVMMQGHSGSGKSTLAKQIQKVLAMFCACEIYSTDELFFVNGVYTFDPKKLPWNHKRNLDRTITALEAGYSVIVDNTNIQRWQAKPYVEYAVARKIPVVFVRAEGNFQNVHGVPAEKVEQMKSQLEDLDIPSVLASRSPFDRK